MSEKKESKIITISNQKGGVGKTTTAQTLGIGLAKKGFKVLLIDSDPQTNLSYTFNLANAVPNLYGVYQNQEIEKCIFELNRKIHIIAGSIQLKDSDSIFTDLGKEYILKNAIENIKNEYDYIIIDTPPTLSLLTINALTVSNEVIIPMQTDIFSMQGLAQLIQQIEAVKKYTNPNIKIRGILLTKYKERNILSKTLYNKIKEATAELNIPLFKSTIREAVLVREAQAQKTNIFDLDCKSKVSQDYISFINEYLKGE